MLSFKFVLWYTLFLFCVEFKIVLYQFLYRCGHFNLSLIANQTISDSFLEMCSPVKRTSESICVKTRSMTAPFDWSQCIFCKQKSYKKDRNLKCVESKDRVKNILHAANNKSDFDMVSLIQSVDNFVENALYHSSCIANDLLNIKSDTVPVEK